MKKPAFGGSTLADVAQEAKVSMITVSRVVRKRGRVSDETRKKVLAAIDRIGYVPNPFASSLASSGSGLVAVVVPSLSRFTDVLRGIDSVMSEHGLQAVFSVTEYNQDWEANVVASLLAWRPMALLLSGIEHLPETVHRIYESKVCCVEIMETTASPIDLVVGFSHEAAGRQSAKYLVSRGYKRIAYVGHDLSGDRRAARRYSSFMSQMAQSGMGVIDELVLPSESSAEAGRLGLSELLRRTPSVDAVYFSNDDMAIGGYLHCLSEGITVPKSLAIMGFNGVALGSALPQPLTTIRTPLYQIGRVAGESALRRSRGEDVPKVQDLGFELIEGGTA